MSGNGTMSRHLHTKHPTKVPKSAQSALDFNGKVVKPYKVKLNFLFEVSFDLFSCRLLMSVNSLILKKPTGPLLSSSLQTIMLSPSMKKLHFEDF